MPCTKSALIAAINSFGAARTTGDANLLNYSATAVSNLVDTLEFAPEPEQDEAPAEAE